MEAVDRFMASMPGYPGRSLWQIYRSLVLRNELADGVIRLRSDLDSDQIKPSSRARAMASAREPLPSL
jgi:polyhydroxyalkanoate synthase